MYQGCNQEEYKRFEGIKHYREDGSEFWSARELDPVLEYSKWENFNQLDEDRRRLVVRGDIRQMNNLYIIYVKKDDLERAKDICKNIWPNVLGKNTVEYYLLLMSI